jgi:hypothetical protein
VEAHGNVVVSLGKVGEAQRKVGKALENVVEALGKVGEAL